jgi:hypothetical protein
VFTIERVGDLSALGDTERDLVRRELGEVGDLHVYWLVSDAERRTVLAPADPRATVGTGVVGFGSFCEAFQEVEVADGSSTVIEIYRADRLDLSP